MVLGSHCILRDDRFCITAPLLTDRLYFISSYYGQCAFFFSFFLLIMSCARERGDLEPSSHTKNTYGMRKRFVFLEMKSCISLKIYYIQDFSQVTNKTNGEEYGGPKLLRNYSRVGGELPLPIITHAPSLVTLSTVRKIVAGPGG